MLSLTNWTTLQDSKMTSKNLEALFNNEIPTIRIPGFASIEECCQLENAIKKIGFDFYNNVEPPIGRIGITQFEYSRKDKNGYFQMAKKANETYQKISSLAFSPLDRLAGILHTITSKKVTIAYENDVLEWYFAGLFRQISVALLHVDFAPLDAPSWKIGEITSQLAWNLYVKVPEHGGICSVYNRAWQPEDELKKIPGSYGYDPVLVKNSQAKHNTPVVGDLVIFNSRNFHEVLAAKSERITCSSFIGKMPNRNLIFWS